MARRLLSPHIHWPYIFREKYFSVIEWKRIGNLLIAKINRHVKNIKNWRKKKLKNFVSRKKNMKNGNENVLCMSLLLFQKLCASSEASDNSISPMICEIRNLISAMFLFGNVLTVSAMALKKPSIRSWLGASDEIIAGAVVVAGIVVTGMVVAGIVVVDDGIVRSLSCFIWMLFVVTKLLVLGGIKLLTLGAVKLLSVGVARVLQAI